MPLQKMPPGAVIVDVAVPTKLSKAQRDALEQDRQGLGLSRS